MSRQIIWWYPNATAPRLVLNFLVEFEATRTAPDAKTPLAVSSAQTWTFRPLLTLAQVPQAFTPCRLGKAILCVVTCMGAADAGSALRATIAADPAMRESRRNMKCLPPCRLRESSKASSAAPAGQRGARYLAHGARETKSGPAPAGRPGLRVAIRRCRTGRR